MKQKTKHTLITAEILGFFLIIIGVLAIMTGRQVFITAAFILFGLIIVVAAIFAVFATLAYKQDNPTYLKKKRAH